MALAQAPGAPGAETELLRYKESWELIGVSEQALKNAIARGRLHPVKFPGISTKYLYRGEVEAYRDKRPWFPPPGTAITPTPAEIRKGGYVPASSLVSMPDMVTYAQTLLREGQNTASAVAAAAAEAAAESAMRPIGDALLPISEAIRDSQRPAPSPQDMTRTDELLALMRVQLSQIVVQLLAAMRPLLDALSAGRTITHEDIAPLMALMQSLMQELQDSPIAPGMRDALSHMPDLLNMQPGTSGNAGNPSPAMAQQSQEG